MTETRHERPLDQQAQAGRVRASVAPGHGRVARRRGALLFDPTGEHAELIERFDAAPDDAAALTLVKQHLIDSQFEVEPLAVIDWYSDGLGLLLFGSVTIHTSSSAAPMISGAGSGTWIERRLGGLELSGSDDAQVWCGDEVDAGTDLRSGIVLGGGVRVELTGAAHSTDQDPSTDSPAHPSTAFETGQHGDRSANGSSLPAPPEVDEDDRFTPPPSPIPPAPEPASHDHESSPAGPLAVSDQAPIRPAASPSPEFASSGQSPTSTGPAPTPPAPAAPAAANDDAPAPASASAPAAPRPIPPAPAAPSPAAAAAPPAPPTPPAPAAPPAAAVPPATHDRSAPPPPPTPPAPAAPPAPGAVEAGYVAPPASRSAQDWSNTDPFAAGALTATEAAPLDESADGESTGDVFEDALTTPAAPVAAAPESGAGLVEAVTCPNGHTNPPQDQLCRTCASPIDSGAATSLISQPSLGHIRFPDGTGVAMDKPHIIGRKPPTGRPSIQPIIVDHAEVSRSHVELRIDGWSVLVVDLGSRNGTWVVPPSDPTPMRLDEQVPYVLEHGTTVHLGGPEASFTYDFSAD